MDTADLDRVEAALGHRFKDRSLLVTALTHSSVSESRVESNERLEFLGDAVLGLVTCELIFQRFPDLLEGEMTKIKSVAVSRKSCAGIARDLGLDGALVIGKGMMTQQALPGSLSAAVLEAIVAAVYLDSDYETVRRFLTPLIDPVIDRAARSGHQQNFKSVLQQHAQQNLTVTPHYVIVDEKGPDHAKAFHVAVELEGRRFEGCWGQSKKQAEQRAALIALRAMGLIRQDEDGELRVVDPAVAAALEVADTDAASDAGDGSGRAPGHGPGGA